MTPAKQKIVLKLLHIKTYIRMIVLYLRMRVRVHVETLVQHFDILNKRPSFFYLVTLLVNLLESYNLKFKSIAIVQ